MSKKKTWIKIKRGLTEPKHRNKIGQKIWLYLHMLDRADWNTGLIYDWRDKDEADDMCMNWRTLRDHRQGLENEGYISCHLAGDHQVIEIHNWTNPREYSGEVYNEKEGGASETVPPENGKGDIEGDMKGDIQGYSKSRTPTLYSHITYQLRMKDMGIFEKLFSKESGIPFPGWDDPKFVSKRWRTPIWKMYKTADKNAELTGDLIKAAVKQMRKDKLTISAPQSIEKTFVSLLGEMNTKPSEEIPNARDL